MEKKARREAKKSPNSPSVDNSPTNGKRQSLGNKAFFVVATRRRKS
ncbi:hypothetical protein [Lysobacter gummosus]